NVLPETVAIGTAAWQISQKFQATYVLILLAFVLTGSLPWLAKGFAQPRYTSSENELITRLTANGYDHEELLSFLSQPNSLLLEGRLLYPRMYRRNEGLSSANPWIAYAERDFARIGFVLINDSSFSNLIFPTREVLNFPQGADAIVLACKTDDYLNVRVVDFGVTTYQSAALSQPCP
ncbi:MAG: hypothetical protein IH588_00775, partial [Anaerolineales bacterium]|nr:hypothetical protein [Anaerolineales bacterium]